MRSAPIRSIVLEITGHQDKTKLPINSTQFIPGIFMGQFTTPIPGDIARQ